MSISIGYHASHEQFAPHTLLALVQKAAKAGFHSIHSSDHFYPWSKAQGHSGFAFAWLGAAMQQNSMPFSTVCAPGQRYHPALVAQAIATLCDMFPGRLTVCLGSGEAINEHITGDDWPDKTARNTRLKRCFELIQSLLAGENTEGDDFQNMPPVKLYTIPSVRPALYGAALTAETAHWMGHWVDGLITVHKPPIEMQQLIQAFREGGGHNKPVIIKMQLSYASSQEKALMGAYEQWRNNVLPGLLLADLPSVAHFEAAGQFIRPEDMHPQVLISADWRQHLDWIQQYAALGIDHIVLHQVSKDQDQFIDDFGSCVLPAI